MNDFYSELLQNIDQIEKVAKSKNHTNYEDITQDSLVRAIEYRESFKMGTNMRAWLSTITYSVFINRYNKSKREQRKLKEKMLTGDTIVKNVVVDSTGEGGRDSNLDIVDEKDILSDMDECRDIDLILRRAKESILDIYVEAVYERYFNGKSYAEIAEIQNIPVGTVMSRIYRGRRKLKEFISEEYPEFLPLNE